ncbi:MAG: lysophospholipid acyltransferase family protein [Chromatiales bacterium]
MRSLRALAFYCGLAVNAIWLGALAVIIWPLPFYWRYRVVTQWNAFALWWLRVTCGLKHRVSGREHVPRGPAIVLCKHQSAWETIALPCLLPPQVLVFKRELLFIPFFGWGLATLAPIVLDRGARHQALRILIAQGRMRLARGLWVTLFPEGTRVAPGTKGRYNAGGGMLAATAGVPVLPIAHNAGVYWPRRSFAKKPGVIDIVIGPAIATAGKDPRQIMAEAEQWIEATSQALLARASDLA